MDFLNRAQQVIMEKQWLEFVATGRVRSIEVLEMMVLHLIETEDPEKPFTDEAISDFFKKKRIMITCSMVEKTRRKWRVRPADERVGA